jgi:predicted negative regulator of RcsB-dependent stress response
MYKALKEGDDLMNAGKLKQALPYYEKVMQAADFKVPLAELILSMKINVIII